MKSKSAIRGAGSFCYEAEDLKPRDQAVDEASIDGFLDRNADALNASIEKAVAEYQRGEYLTIDQVRANLDAQLRQLHAYRT
jgi:hypothetical protein